MLSTTNRETAARPVPVGMTLLDLVTRLNETTENEEETVDAALALLERGRVKLTGSFRHRRFWAS